LYTNQEKAKSPISEKCNRQNNAAVQKGAAVQNTAAVQNSATDRIVQQTEKCSSSE
jgi:hypothetical protein